MDSNFARVVKIVLIGQGFISGLQQLNTRFVRQIFDPHGPNRTIGIDFQIKRITINNELIKVQSWQTQFSRFGINLISKAYFRRAMGAILVYNITDQQSFTFIKDKIDQIQDSKQSDCEIILVGTHLDKEEKRKVLREDGQLLAKHLKCLFFQTSAKTGQNVGLAFNSLFQLICQKNKQLNLEHSNPYKLKPVWVPGKTSSSCF